MSTTTFRLRRSHTPPRPVPVVYPASAIGGPVVPIRCGGCGRLLARAVEGASAFCPTCRVWSPPLAKAGVL